MTMPELFDDKIEDLSFFVDAVADTPMEAFEFFSYVIKKLEKIKLARFEMIK